jgi:lysyl-tRNA synthetase class 2
MATDRHPHRRVRGARQALNIDLAARQQRARIVAAIREFFVGRGFLEVETPIRVVCPGLEPHLVAIPSGPDRWLRTSPELHLKRLLAAGSGPIFELARCFRGDEAGPWHRTEFTMLEWYRPNATLDAIAEDVALLLPVAAQAAGLPHATIRGCDLKVPLERISVRAVVQRETGIDLAAHSTASSLANALNALGLRVAQDDDWDALFFRLMIERVEPKLGRERATILFHYPASQAALANTSVDADGWPIALRFEVYLAGIELANAFDELTDAQEQRRRHLADQAARRQAGREVPALDEQFLAALERGMPPSAGIALGVDRLIALVCGRDRIES